MVEHFPVKKGDAGIATRRQATTLAYEQQLFQLARSDPLTSIMTYHSIQEIESIVRSFEQCQLPRSQWTHEAHLAVGFWVLTHYSPSEAIERMKSGIQRYNQSVGIPNSRTSGYHETITLFWLRKIQAILVDQLSTQFTPMLWNQLNQQCSNPKLPLRYYSHDYLMSWQARSSWVEPDLRPLF